LRLALEDVERLRDDLDGRKQTLFVGISSSAISLHG
jgi:hypothetical protein